MNYKKIKFWALVILIFASLSLFFFADKLGIDNNLSTGNLQNDIPSVIIYILWMTFASATTLPISVILVPGILLFSFQWAIILSFIGIILGAVIMYYLTIILGKDFVDEYVGKHGEKLRIVRSMIKKNSFGILLALNSFYFFPSTLAHVVAGLTKTKFWKFIIPTIIGNFINFFFLGLLTLGFSEGNYNYVYTSLVILVLNSLIPLIIYRKHLMDILRVSFGN